MPRNECFVSQHQAAESGRRVSAVEMLSSLIQLRPASSQAVEPEPEDIFTSSLGLIFTDDLQNQHGDPGMLVVYKPSRNPLAWSELQNDIEPDPLRDALTAKGEREDEVQEFRIKGEIELKIADPKSEDSRKCFAHYLWNAGVLMGELVGGCRLYDKKDNIEHNVVAPGSGWWVSRQEEFFWKVDGHSVLELGAGLGLAGIISSLSGAQDVTISDYPAPELLQNITANVQKNVPPVLRSRISIVGHEWGDTSSPFALANASRFTRVFAADCLWMSYQHHNLALSMLHFLSPSPDARVFVIAGFHTGRARLAPFFETVIEEVGLQTEDIYEMDADGKRRAWAAERDSGRENVGERNKWLVVARLRRKPQVQEAQQP